VELDKLKDLLGIALTDLTKDFVLQFCLDNTTETILNYCNMNKMPDALKNTGYRMAMDLYRNENIGNEKIALGAVSSISEGDTSVSYKNVATDYTQSLIKNYQAQLNKYRVLSW